jgi:hypothetical protein
VIGNALLEDNRNNLLRSQAAILIRQSSAQVMTSINIYGPSGAGQGS